MTLELEKRIGIHGFATTRRGVRITQAVGELPKIADGKLVKDAQVQLFVRNVIVKVVIRQLALGFTEIIAQQSLVGDSS